MKEALTVQAGQSPDSGSETSRPDHQGCACDSQASKCDECRGDDLLYRRAAEGAEAPSTLPKEVFTALSSRGMPLDRETRARMERYFQHDFSTVRLHADAISVSAARSVGALAFTVGKDIFLDSTRLTAQQDQAVIAHELSHTIQEEAVPRAAGQHLAVDRHDSISERQAQDVERGFLNQTRLPGITPTTQAAVHRQTAAGGSKISADPVVLMQIDESADPQNNLRLTFQSGKTRDGYVTDFDLQPGVYTLIKKSNHTWEVSPSAAGLHFTVHLPNPGGEGGADRGDLDPFALAYTNTMLEVRKEQDTAAPTGTTVEQRVRTITDLLTKTWTRGSDEETIINLIESTPSGDADALNQALSTAQINGKPLLDEIDRVVDGENNFKLHQVLSLLELKSHPETAAAALHDAPVLPWHDAMGFFEDTATFSAEAAGPGKVTVQYNGGTRLLTSADFAHEVKQLPFNLFVGGQTYAANDLLVIHDYDRGSFIPVTAGNLLGYVHSGIRKFLQDAATIASFAMPISATESAVLKVAYVALERVLPAVFLLIEENRLNIVKWFPNWGPKMLRYADIVKAGVAVIGLARFAVSGWQTFSEWKDIIKARRALEAAASSSPDAERIAAALEREATDTCEKASVLRKAQLDAEATKSEAGTPVSGSAGAPSATTKAESARPAATPPQSGGATPTTTSPEAHGPPTGRGDTAPASAPEPATATSTAAQPNPLAGVTKETVDMLDRNQPLRNALLSNPLAASALTLCKSPCVPAFATEAQVARLQKLLRDAADHNIPLNLRAVREELHAKPSAKDLDDAIGAMERAVSVKKQVAEDFSEVQALGGDPDFAGASIAEGPALTDTIRNAPGVAHGGQRLARASERLLPDGRIGRFPGQIAARMRGMHFKTFAEFRETFWQMVAGDPLLNQGWTLKNLNRMRSGSPPFAMSAEAVGGGSNAVLQLNHIRALKNAGSVYDLDNLEIVSPLFHQAIGD